jgi:hypothetical protein
MDITTDLLREVVVVTTTEEEVHLHEVVVEAIVEAEVTVEEDDLEVEVQNVVDMRRVHDINDVFLLLVLLVDEININFSYSINRYSIYF